MKRYDTEYICTYIESNIDDIDIVRCGMAEDWGCTFDVVFCDDRFLSKIDWDERPITVYGINGSIWATPVMQICYKDGRIEVVPCWFEDGVEPSEEVKRVSDHWRKHVSMDSVYEYGRNNPDYQ